MLTRTNFQVCEFTLYKFYLIFIARTASNFQDVNNIFKSDKIIDRFKQPLFSLL